MIAWMLCILLCMWTAPAWAADSSHQVEQIGLTITVPPEWVIDGEETLQRINVMQMDDKLTHPTLLASMALHTEEGLRRIELSYEQTQAFTCAAAYLAALLVDADGMFLQLGEQPEYALRLDPQAQWLGMSIATDEQTWISWVIPHQDGFYTLQISYPTANAQAYEEIWALISLIEVTP